MDSLREAIKYLTDTLPDLYREYYEASIESRNDEARIIAARIQNSDAKKSSLEIKLLTMEKDELSLELNKIKRRYVRARASLLDRGHNSHSDPISSSDSDE